MATNVYFDRGTTSEKRLYEDLMIEQLKAFGQECFYIPRTLVAKDNIFGEDSLNKFSAAYMIEMYVEDVQGFAGEGDLIGKFGLEVRDQVTFVVSRRRFEMLVRENANLIESSRPNEGDLVYMDRFKKLFKIDFVEDEDPFYQVSDLPVFKLKCSVFEYSHEEFDTGITEIDQAQTIEDVSTLNFQIGLETSLGSGSILLEPEVLEVVNLESGTFNKSVVELEGGIGTLGSENIDDNILLEDQDDVTTRLTDQDGNTISLEDDPSDKTYIIQESYSIETNDEYADNATFETEAGFDTPFNTEDDLLDFSEKNPFGEPKP
tara:strand:- start:138 stop:1094 length:957 start_codon:yes stop_codon:yes gene_type:complete